MRTEIRNFPRSMSNDHRPYLLKKEAQATLEKHPEPSELLTVQSFFLENRSHAKNIMG